MRLVDKNYLDVPKDQQFNIGDRFIVSDDVFCSYFDLTVSNLNPLKLGEYQAFYDADECIWRVLSPEEMVEELENRKIRFNLFLRMLRDHTNSELAELFKDFISKYNLDISVFAEAAKKELGE